MSPVKEETSNFTTETYLDDFKVSPMPRNFLNSSEG